MTGLTLILARWPWQGVSRGCCRRRLVSDNRTESFGATVEPMAYQICPVDVDDISGLGMDSSAMLVEPSAHTNNVASLTAKGLEQAGIDVSQTPIPASASDSPVHLYLLWRARRDAVALRRP